MKLSVIIPCRNIQDKIDEIYNKLNKVLDALKYELLFIDNGSTDGTLEKLNALYDKDVQHIKILSFSRTFPLDAVFGAGLEYTTGDYTCFFDTTTKEEVVLEMYQYLEDNSSYDSVVMQYDGIQEKGVIPWLYQIGDKLCSFSLERNTSYSRMFRKNVKETLIQCNENIGHIKGLFLWMGFQTKYIIMDGVHNKVQITTSYVLKEIATYVVQFTNKPFRIANFLGKLSILGAFLYIFILLILNVGFGSPIQAISILFVLFGLFFGILFLLLGSIGSYLSSILFEIKNRPKFIIKRKIGFEEDTLL